jgi:hypothetical protein
VIPARPIRSWWSRAGARCRSFDRPVSPARIPEPGVRVATHRALHGTRQRRSRWRSATQYPQRAGARSERRYSPAAPACRPAAAVPLCPFAMWPALPASPTTTGTPPRPAASSGPRACPGQGGDGSLPTFTVTRSARSAPSSTPAASPRLRRRLRRDLLAGIKKPASESPPTWAACTAARPASVRLEPVEDLRDVKRWFLAYTFWPCLPDPDRLTVPTRPGVVRAAPTLPCVSTVGLPSASPACCDSPAAGPFIPPGATARRGAP